MRTYQWAKIILFCGFCLISTIALASYYSLETNQVVKEGDTMEKVRAACGTPTHVIIRDEVVSIPVEVTDWVYMSNFPKDPTKTRYYLPILTVTFDGHNQVSKLQRSQVNPPIESSAVAVGIGTVKAGDDMASVRLACGVPTLINKRQSSEEVAKKIVEWIYQKNTALAPIVFRFENGVLRNIN